MAEGDRARERKRENKRETRGGRGTERGDRGRWGRKEKER